jgi:hypothetical protein
MSSFDLATGAPGAELTGCSLFDPFDFEAGGTSYDPFLISLSDGFAVWGAQVGGSYYADSVCLFDEAGMETGALQVPSTGYIAAVVRSEDGTVALALENGVQVYDMSGVATGAPFPCGATGAFAGASDGARFAHAGGGVLSLCDGGSPTPLSDMDVQTFGFGSSTFLAAGNARVYMEDGYLKLLDLAGDTEVNVQGTDDDTNGCAVHHVVVALDNTFLATVEVCSYTTLVRGWRVDWR